MRCVQLFIFLPPKTNQRWNSIGKCILRTVTVCLYSWYSDGTNTLSYEFQQLICFEQLVMGISKIFSYRYLLILGFNFNSKQLKKGTTLWLHCVKLLTFLLMELPRRIWSFPVHSGVKYTPFYANTDICRAKWNIWIP